jgi:hypothetical protein
LERGDADYLGRYDFVTSAEAGFQSRETVKGVLADPVRGGPPSPLEKILLFAINRQDRRSLATGGRHGNKVVPNRTRRRLPQSPIGATYGS